MRHAYAHDAVIALAPEALAARDVHSSAAGALRREEQAHAGRLVAS